jgi:hypothetical protein
MRSVEEELEAAQSKASNKGRLIFFRLDGGRASRFLATYVGVPKWERCQPSRRECRNAIPWLTIRLRPWARAQSLISCLVRCSRHATRQSRMHQMGTDRRTRREAKTVGSRWDLGDWHRLGLSPGTPPACVRLRQPRFAFLLLANSTHRDYSFPVSGAASVQVPDSRSLFRGVRTATAINPVFRSANLFRRTVSPFFSRR